MEVKISVLLSAVVFLAGVILSTGSAAAIYLDDETDTCIVFQPDSGDGDNAIACFYVNFVDPDSGKPISYFHDPEPITPSIRISGGDDVHHRSVIDSQGNIHIVWMCDIENEIWEIFYTKISPTGEVLTDSLIRISDWPVGNQTISAYPSLALDSDENVLVVWMDMRDGVWEIYYSKIDTNGVDLTVPDVRLSDADGANSGRWVDPGCDWEVVAESETGNPIVAVHACFPEHPDIAVDPGDTVHVVWSDDRDGSWRIYYQSQANEARPETPIIDDTLASEFAYADDCWYPAITIGPKVQSSKAWDYGVHIAWQQFRGQNEWHIYYRKQHSSNGSYIISDIALSGGVDGFHSTAPDIAVDDSDHVHLAFMDNRAVDPGHKPVAGKVDIHIDHQWEVYVTTYNTSGGSPIPWRLPKRESDLTATDSTSIWGDPLYGEYTGPGSPSNLFDGPSMYPRISSVGEKWTGWSNVAWQDCRDYNWEIYYTSMGNYAKCPHADLRVTFDTTGADKFPEVAKENTDRPDICWQKWLAADKEWEGYHARWNEDQYITVTFGSKDGKQSQEFYLFQADYRDTNAFDGVEYRWNMALPDGYYDALFNASIDGGQTIVSTSQKTYEVRRWTPPRYGVANEDRMVRPDKFELGQNHPNPFNPTTALRYQIPVSSHITLRIYDLLGREVRTVVDEVQPAGSYSVEWNGRDNRGENVASGIYFYRLRAGDHEMTRRMVLLR